MPDKQIAVTERKIVELKGLKLEESGAFKALFAPFNSVDKQGDLTLPGAFGRQRVVISAYGHGSWGDGSAALPVGKGEIYDGEEGGIVEGKFFLNTTAGRDTYTTVKELGDLQEFSYALPEIDYEMRDIDGRTIRVLKKIRVNEVSPVLMGAGNGTRLLGIKSGDEPAKGVLSFVDHIEKVAIAAEDVYERLGGRMRMRDAESKAPTLSDLKRMRELKARFDVVSAKIGEIIESHDALNLAFTRFQAINPTEDKKE